MDQNQQLPVEDIQEEEEQIQLGLESKKQSFFSAFTCLVIPFSLIALFMAYRIAQSLQNNPSIIISQYQNAIPPLANPIYHKKIVYKEYDLSQLEEHLSILPFKEYSVQRLIEIEGKNQIHREYEKMMRHLNYENSKKMLQGYSSNKISSEYSSITYNQYLFALQKLTITTYNINDQSIELKTIKSKTKDAYLTQYGTSKNEQLSICVILALTESGLQSRNYYFALKSIFQQVYNNYQVFIINHEKSYENDNIIDLLSLITSKRQATFVNFTYNEGFNLGAAIYTVIQTSCRQSYATLLLRDNGQLIGQYVFSQLNEAHIRQRAPIVFTNYIMKSQSFITIKQDYFAYKLQIYPKNIQKSKSLPYKSKYLKSYETSLLLQLPQSVFQTINGEWKVDKLQGALEFSALQKSCGRYYLQEEIMYAASNKDIQTAYQVLDAQKHKQLTCMGITEETSTQIQQNVNNKVQKGQHVHDSGSILENFVEQNEKEVFSDEQILLFQATVRNSISKRREVISFQQEKYQKQSPTFQQNKKILQILQKLQQQISIEHYFPQFKNRSDQKASEVHNNINYTEKARKIRQKVHFMKLSNTSVNDKSLQEFINTPYHFSDQINPFCGIIINHNGFEQAQYLYTIQSVLKQRYYNYRLIVYDNKSTDLSLKVIKYHLSLIPQSQRSKIKLIHAKNGQEKSQIVYELAHKYCKENDVIFLLQNGEQFVDSFVMRRVNHNFIEKKPLLISSRNLIHSKPQIANKKDEKNMDNLSSDNFRIGKEYNFMKGLLINKLQKVVFQDINAKWLNKSTFQYLFSKSLKELACKDYHEELDIIVKTNAILAPTKDELINILKRKRLDCFRSN